MKIFRMVVFDICFAYFRVPKELGGKKKSNLLLSGQIISSSSQKILNSVTQGYEKSSSQITPEDSQQL
jgi:hypothetical protein